MKKKIYLVLLFPFFVSISGKSFFQNIKDIVNPFAGVRALQQQYAWALQAPSDQVIAQMNNICSSVTDEYLTEIKCLAGIKRAYTKSGLNLI